MGYITNDWLDYTPTERQETQRFLEAEMGSVDTMQDAIKTMREATVEIYSLRNQLAEKDKEITRLKVEIENLSHVTDGPWRISESKVPGYSREISIVGPDNVSICRMDGAGSSNPKVLAEVRANAALIVRLVNYRSIGGY